MDENAARSVLLIRAIEISDTDGEVLTPNERTLASREAGELRSESEESDTLSTEEESFLIRRARRLYERLVQKFPAADNAKNSHIAWVTASIGAASFFLGIATNALGETNRVNIIAFPLLGMLVWNAAVYLLLIGERLRARQPREQPQLLRRAVVSMMLPSRILKLRSAPAALVKGIQRYHDDWSSAAAPIYFARAKSVLHLAAALLALGAVAGMYLRGIGFEYLAGWESTFLRAGDLRPLLNFILGPASLLTGIALPGEHELASLRWSATQPGENAARWIHLWATTAMLAIVAPRLVLAIAARVKESKLARNFGLPVDPYFRRLLRGGVGERVRIVPFSYQLTERGRENIRKSLTHVLGEGVQIRFTEGAQYGAEENALAAEASGPVADRLCVLFNLAATPEGENHEFFLRGLQDLVAQGRVARELIAFVDESSYRARFASGSARIEERRQAWRDLLAPYKHAFLDLHDPDPGDLKSLFGSEALS